MNSINMYSRIEFIDFISSRRINDETVDSFENEYFISIIPTKGPDSKVIFLRDHRNVITMRFDDVLTNDEKKTAITKEQAKELAKFIKGIPQNTTVHIHCVHGFSRSTAIATAVINRFGKGNKLVDHLLLSELL